MFSLIAWPSSQYDGQLVPFAHFQAYLLFFFFPGRVVLPLTQTCRLVSQQPGKCRGYITTHLSPC